MQVAEIDFAGFDFVQDAVDRQFITVGLVDGPADLGLPGEQGVDLHSLCRQGTDAVERDDVVDVRNGNGQPPIFGVVIERQQMVALGQFARYQRQRRRIDDRVGQVDAQLAQAFGQRITQGCFRNKTERNQQFADRLVGLHLLQQGDAQLIFAKNSLGDQELTDLLWRMRSVHGLEAVVGGWWLVAGGGVCSGDRLFSSPATKH